MGVSINWLKDYVDFDWSPEDLAHHLTMAGIEVEGIDVVGDDHTLELDLTPNRGDCLGMINLARELAAVQGKEVKIPELHVEENDEDIQQYIDVEINNPDLCRRYAARMVKNVTVKPSPDWMQERLIASGIRPINNVVDVTNFVLLETNQPLHAFDYDLLGEQKKIIVRTARPGESIITLDDIERPLSTDMLLITESDQPVALAGIMGGQNSEIQENTTRVLIESAWFNRVNIRRTSRKLALRSESSIRFEKGADINGILYAADRAAQLIAELGDGEVVGGVVDCYPDPQLPVHVSLRPQRVNQLLGIELDKDTIRSLIQRLGFRISEEEGVFKVYIPTYRPDITMEVDLIEEVARLYGYDKIPAVLPNMSTTQGGLDPYQRFVEHIKTILSAQLYEVVNYSFISPKYFSMLHIPEDDKLREVVHIANPLSEEYSVMRTLLLPGLLDTMSRNLARKNNNLAMFEVGAVFHPSAGNLPDEVSKVGAIVAGKTESNWIQNAVSMDFFYLKGIVERLLYKLGIPAASWVENKELYYHPGRSAMIVVEDRVIGTMGEIHPAVRAEFDIRPRACAFELDVKNLFELSRSPAMRQQIARYPSIERDLAIIVDDSVKAVDMLAVIKQHGQPLLQDVVVFDIYTGDQVPRGSKSAAFRLTFQSIERTLNEEEVNVCMDEIMQALADKMGAELR